MTSQGSWGGAGRNAGIENTEGLRVRGLSVSFPGQGSPALDDVSLDVPAGQVLALLGPSGCGKSTALRVVAGLQPAAGSVSYDGVDLTRTPAHRRGFSLMFQDGQLFGHLDVFENVAYGLRRLRPPGGLGGLRRRGVPEAEIVARVEELLDLVGLAGLGAREPATLSGGQQQRVALARALAPRPRLLLLDEPLSSLDRALRERLAVDLRRVLRAEGVTALFVTHDHDEALTVADGVALMRDGRIVQSGAMPDVWRTPVDADAARFMGYVTILRAEDSRRLGLSAGEWAFRRTAWRLADADEGDAHKGHEGYRGVITQLSGAGDLVNLTVALDVLKGHEVAATVLTGSVGPELGEGSAVDLVLDFSQAARLL